MSDISFTITPLELASFFAALAFLALAIPVLDLVGEHRRRRARDIPAALALVRAIR